MRGGGDRLFDLNVLLQDPERDLPTIDRLTRFGTLALHTLRGVRGVADYGHSFNKASLCSSLAIMTMHIS